MSQISLTKLLIPTIITEKVENNLFKFRLSTPQFHTDPLSSTHKFNRRNTSFQNPKSLSSTRKIPQFNTPLSLYRAIFCQFSLS